MSKSHYVTDEHDRLYRDTVRKLREDLGRDVIVVLPGAKRKCPNCIFNNVTGRSAGIYSPLSSFPSDVNSGAPIPFTHGPCPVCKGTGSYGQTPILEKPIKCHIRWLVPGEKLDKTAMGDLLDADCRLQADIQYQKDFSRPPVKVTVDGIDCEVMKLYPRGLKKLTQIIVFLKKSNLNVPGNKGRTTYEGGPL